jgi:hypothetical protein
MHPLLLKAGIGAAALAAGVGFAVCGSSSPAVAQGSPPLYVSVTILNPATLVAYGAAVQVPVFYDCAAGDNGYLTLSITERVSFGGTAFGSTSTVVPCYGYHVTKQVIVPSQNGVYFSAGSPIAQVSLSECTWFACEGAQHTAHIAIY